MDNGDVYYISNVSPLLAQLGQKLQEAYQTTKMDEKQVKIFNNIPSMAKYLLELGRINPEDYLMIRGFFAEINDTGFEPTEFNNILATMREVINKI